MGSVAIFKGKLVKFLAKAGILVPARPDGDRSGTPAAGETAFNTTANKLEVYDGSGWVQLGGGGTGVGLSHPTVLSTYESGTNNVTMSGTANTAIGVNAGVSITTGTGSTLFGHRAGELLTTGGSNIAIGQSALAGTSSGDTISNIAIGYNAGFGLNGSNNIFIGRESGSAASSSPASLNNTFVGSVTGFNFTTGSGNVALGRNAFSNPTSGSNNTFINSAGPFSAISGAVAIGKDSAGTNSVVTQNNDFALGTANHRYLLPGRVGTVVEIGPNGTSTGQTGTVRLFELATNGTNFVAFRASDNIASDVTWTLPAADGTSGQVLSTDGAGTLSWAAGGPSPTSTITTAGYALSSTALNAQTISYTLQASDNGRIVVVNSAVAVNVTVPSGLAVGFNCMVVQIGTGQVTMVASGTTLNSAGGLKILKQHGALSIISYSSDVFNVSGNTTI